MTQANNILKYHKLRITGNRQKILSLFLKEQVALSHSEIEDVMQEDCDRVTIYRTLSSFLENGIVHKVLDDSGVLKYALCAEECDYHEAHHHNHVHFKCNLCHNTSCLHEVQAPSLALPQGYQMDEIAILIQGICPNCHTN